MALLGCGWITSAGFDIRSLSVKLLAQIDEKNPLFTTLAGVTGGAASLIMPFLDTVAHVAQIIGTMAGATIAVMSLVVKIRHWRNRPITPPREEDFLP